MALAGSLGDLRLNPDLSYFFNSSAGLELSLNYIITASKTFLSWFRKYQSIF
ncbi:hypothetical protein NBRC110019_17270 [Neptunitalea chrysea]|uniref:Uncharacterized protein n=1 Tax=Neptunitalea chrysea TaxID=1647581 RepID=A0A9W6EVM7_9FLAO|nr:hypothetical protein NBRC110019_17270 [Neptunitalea chrysea]